MDTVHSNTNHAQYFTMQNLLQKKIYIKNNGSQMENNNCTTVETIANTSLANIHLQEDKPSQKITLLYIYIQTSSLQPPT